jgi:hypothetical protein
VDRTANENGKMDTQIMNVAKINFERSVLNHWSKEKKECVEMKFSNCVMDKKTRLPLRHTYNNPIHLGIGFGSNRNHGRPSF